MVCYMRHIIIAIVVTSISCIASGALAAKVVLTDQVLTRYEATFPEIRKLTLQLEEISSMPDSDEKSQKLQDVIAKKEECLRAKGWADFSEYMDTMGRVTQALVPLRVLAKFAKHPAEKRAQAQDQVIKELKDKEFSEDEIRTLIRHIPRLNKMLDKAGMLPKDR